MRVLVYMDMAYHVSERKYKQVLEDIRDTGGADIEKYGKCLGRVMRITDMTQEEAASELDNLKEN